MKWSLMVVMNRKIRKIRDDWNRRWRIIGRIEKVGIGISWERSN